MTAKKSKRGTSEEVERLRHELDVHKDQAARVLELERENERLAHEVERRSHDFFAHDQATELQAFALRYAESGRLSPRDLGRLVTAFNERFHYDLLVRHYMENDLHGQYMLFVVARFTSVTPMEGGKKIPKRDEIAMNNYVRGFAAACEAAG